MALALTVQQHQWDKSSTLAQSLFLAYLGDLLLFTLIGNKQETGSQNRNNLCPVFEQHMKS